MFEDIARDVAQGFLNARNRGGDIEGGEFVVAGERLRPGNEQQGAQVAASDGGEVGRGGRGDRKREGRILLGCEEAPTAIEGRGQAVPVDGALVGGFDGEQYAQGLIAERFDEGVTDFVHEQGLAKGGAVGERLILHFCEFLDVEIESPFAAKGQESAREGQGSDDRVAAVGFALDGQFEGGHGVPCAQMKIRQSAAASPVPTIWFSVFRMAKMLFLISIGPVSVWNVKNSLAEKHVKR